MRSSATTLQRPVALLPPPRHWSQSALVARPSGSAFIEFHLLEMLFQVSTPKEFRRSIVTVSPPFRDCTLHHPLPRERVPQVPFGIMLWLLHAHVFVLTKLLHAYHTAPFPTYALIEN
jgi:hypothetical protein